MSATGLRPRYVEISEFLMESFGIVPGAGVPRGRKGSPEPGLLDTARLAIIEGRSEDSTAPGRSPSRDDEDLGQPGAALGGVFKPCWQLTLERDMALEFGAGKTRVGWIGTGVMGSSMCGHLIAAGYQAIVFNRTAEKTR